MDYLVERDWFSEAVEAENWARAYDVAASLLITCKTHKVTARNPRFWVEQEKYILGILRAFPDVTHSAAPVPREAPSIVRPKPLRRMALVENVPNTIRSALDTLPEPPKGTKRKPVWRCAEICL